MSNPKTSIMGVCVALSVIVQAAITALGDGGLAAVDWNVVVTGVLSGLGLVVAGDARAARKEIRR